MEPDVIRMYSSSPPPMEDGAEEEDDEFGDFGTFSGVPNSISFTDFDTPTTFNQTQALTATSPPELGGSSGGRGVTGYSSSNGSHAPGNEPSKANGVAPASCPGGGPSERTEMKKLVSGSLNFSTSDSCNGAEVLTNGFATFELQESPSLQNSVHSHVQETSSEDMGSAPVCGPEDDFADFAAFSDTEGRISHTASEDLNDTVATASCTVDTPGHGEQETSEDNVRDTNRPGIFMSGTESVSVPTEQNMARTTEATATDVCTNSPLAVNGGNAAERDESKDELFPDSEAGQSDETETETSLGRPLSTDALEEYGDMSTTGSVPSPPLQGETSTPADHSQLPEDDEDEDFGDFGDAGSFGGQGFADFDQLEQSGSTTAQELADDDGNNDDDFGDFNSPKLHSSANKEHNGDEFANFPVSDSFGNFSSAIEDVGAREDTGWSAFGEQQGEGESWAAFGAEQSVTPPAESGEKGEEEEEEEWHEGDAPAAGEDDSRTHRQTVSLSSRLEKLFQSSFPQNTAVTAAPVEEQVVSLHVLLEEKPESGGEEQRSWRGGVWTQLQDIHEAFGLRYQWGGSHCNKVLLCCLGIDTRNILFTGQKKQPVIVPMYAASLGMLEPTKEPVKPVSAAEMIASIAQTPPLAPEKTSCSTDSVQQEALPPVQFDWSSSGLTNPLDASGGSSLLNLDFFGPVEDSGSSSSPSIPGVDPELYELTTAKLDPSGSSSRVADAFARLMSTMEKTSTSTRKPRKDENLSDEAAKVIAALPDLSFMQAKVLMFPATLTPLSSQATSD